MKGGEKCTRRGECWTLCDTHRQQLKRGLDKQAKGGVAKSAIWNSVNDEVRERGIKAREESLAGRKPKRKPKPNPKKKPAKSKAKSKRRKKEKKSPAKATVAKFAGKNTTGGANFFGGS